MEFVDRVDTRNLGHLGDEHALQHFQATASHLHSLVYWQSAKLATRYTCGGRRIRLRFTNWKEIGSRRRRGSCGTHRTKDIQVRCCRSRPMATRTEFCGRQSMQPGTRGTNRDPECFMPTMATTSAMSYGTLFKFQGATIVESTPRWRRQLSRTEGSISRASVRKTWEPASFAFTGFCQGRMKRGWLLQHPRKRKCLAPTLSSHGTLYLAPAFIECFERARLNLGLKQLQRA